jgi:nucleotide-binding universal stress UspA family protein
VLKTILVAYDGSEPAARAFQFALDLAKPLQARIRVLAVTDRSELPTAAEMAGLLESSAEESDRAFADMQDKAQAAGVILDTRNLIGQPAQDLIREASEQKADLVVVGRHRRGRIDFWMTCSDLYLFVNCAPCPVTVVS